DDAVRAAGNPTSKSSMEMENHVFQKAKSREEYLALVARLILHVRDSQTKKDQQRQGGGPQQDPMNALQNLTSLSQGQPSQQAMQMSQPSQLALQSQLAQSTQQAMQQQMSQQPQFQQQPPPQQFQQSQQPFQHSQQAFQQSQQPFQTSQQPLPPQPPQPGGQARMAPTMQQQQQQERSSLNVTQYAPGGSKWVRQQKIGGLLSPSQQLQGQSPGSVQVASPAQSSAMQRPVASPAQTSSMQRQVASPAQTTTMHRQVASPAQTGSIQRQVASPAQPGSMQRQVASPAQPGSVQRQHTPQSSSQSAASPATMLPSPSPQPSMAPSPASTTARTPAGVQSPVSLNTPGNPGSVGMAPSPRNATEEQAYLEKWKQLSKYIDPLQRMIKRVSNTDEHKKDLSKMKNLLEILTDQKKRLQYQTLLKCEQVLEKLELQMKMSHTTSSTSTTTTTTPAPLPKSQQHMCQPLLDAVASQLGSPMLNHTLKRTFGPALTALHGPPICFPGPPPKRQRTIPRQECSIPNILQGEVAKLDQKFKVSLDPTQNNSSTSVHLVCKLDDRSLPSVPPIFVVVPEQYPEESPQCTAESHDYDSTSFLQTVKKSLDLRLLKLPDQHSLTQLLGAWEMSVRQACKEAVAITT
ncbi:mediator complex subunit Med15, partial [Branchiostoma belcheri]